MYMQHMQTEIGLYQRVFTAKFGIGGVNWYKLYRFTR